jgi:release factor glutamine methyltransferase
MFSRTKTLRESFQHFQLLIQATYDADEARSISQLVFKEVLGYDTIKLILNENELLAASLFEQLDQIAFLLNQHKPIQYILGYEDFMGLRFKVDENVLIPRPETEELVEWIIKEHKNSNTISIADFGTGSGCIAISLKKNLPSATIKAFDISTNALAIAQYNAMQLKQEVSFIHFDVLKDELNEQFEVMVSNPPYVLESEKQQMRKNVLAYEPTIALFVEDTDPLLFYRRIIQHAEQHLCKAGYLYFEINESYASETLALFDANKWENIELKKDIRDKERMIRAKLKD